MSNNRMIQYSFLFFGGLGIVFNISGCGTEEKGSTSLKQEPPSTVGLTDFKTNGPPTRCPKGTLLMTSTIDYAEDIPGGPQTPEQAIQEYIDMDDKRDIRPKRLPGDKKLSVEQFSKIPKTITSEKSDTSSKFVYFRYSDPQLGDYTIELAKPGDSWRVSSTQICNSLDSALRGKS